MKLFGCVLVLVGLSGCGLMKHRHDISEQRDEIVISRMSRVSFATVQEIADAEGGKEDGEIWHVDRSKGKIRIRKSREGSPMSGGELWSKDAEGTWVSVVEE